MAEKRDPRSWWIDEDPFDRLESKRPPPSHSSARDDGRRRNTHVRVVLSSTGGQGGEPFFRVFGSEPQPMSATVHKGSVWHFSSTEIEHLTVATIAFTAALGFAFGGGIGGAVLNLPGYLMLCSLLLIAIAPAFVIHEMAHKIVARKYGCWAEFRMSPGGLRFGVLLAAILQVVFMAPGAVMVIGNTTKPQFGKIALAGPVSNLCLWLLGIVPLAAGLGGYSEITDFILYYWLLANAFLATFNMLPFGPLDGKKIKTWSDSMFWMWFIICLGILNVTWGLGDQLPLRNAIITL